MGEVVSEKEVTTRAQDSTYTQKTKTDTLKHSGKPIRFDVTINDWE